jgi:hypothetical protein
VSVASAILSFSPSSYWKLDEASGNFLDQVGGITGTPVGSPAYAQSPITPGDTTGSSVRFDVVDGDTIQFGDVYNFTGSAQFTTLAWLKPISYDAGGGHWLWSAEGAGVNGWYFRLANPAVTFEAGRGDAAGFDTVSYFMTEATYESGNVMMVSSRYNGTNQIININGVDVASAPSSKTMTNDVQGLAFGAYTGLGSAYDGYADDIAIFSTALTEANLLTIYTAAGQALVPDADVTTTGWTATPLWSKLNDNSDATLVTATAA